MKAAIDIGSNSILFLAIDGQNNIVANESRVTGLGRGLDQIKSFSEEAMADSEAAFKEYFELCQVHGIAPEDVIVTATEASRVATNASEFFNQIRKRYGFGVTIITGLAEAHFSTMGVLMDQNITDSEITIMDIGGASTELIRVNVAEKKILNSFSMPVGVIRLNNWKEEGVLKERMLEVLKSFEEKIKAVASSKIYCVAGTMTSVGNIVLGNQDYIENEVHGIELSLTDLVSLHDKYADKTAEEMLELFPFLGKRSKSIYSGFILAKTVLQWLECDTIYISTYGLRYGTLNSGGIEDGFIFKTEAL